MATDAVEICNLALVRVGVKQLLDSLTENTAEAITCNALYPEQRDVILAERQWSFAKAEATLAELSGVTRTGWSRCYALPSDCVVPRFIWPGSHTPDNTLRIPWERQAADAGDGSILCTDAEDAVLIYTRRIEAVPAFPPHFVDALAWLLAAELVVSLPLRPELEPGARQRYRAALATASAKDASAEFEAPVKSRYERAR